ncbi:Aminoacyl-tRNA editing domain protein [Candidatus Burarchaeum australiense]|nr:Aminoacyl-tRNA editing domain protein [Candidatus Burarchaeum australiense]
MDAYEEKLKRFITEHGISAEHLSFQQSCHSVEDAAKAANAPVSAFVKNVCMLDAQGNPIVAIVKGEDRASTTRVAEALGIERPRLATPDEILQKTGYPCGGTPSFGYAAKFLIDSKVMEMETIYSGGGSESSLTRLSPKEMQEANSGQIVRVRK